MKSIKEIALEVLTKYSNRKLENEHTRKMIAGEIENLIHAQFISNVQIKYVIRSGYGFLQSYDGITPLMVSDYILAKRFDNIDEANTIIGKFKEKGFDAEVVELRIVGIVRDSL